MKIRTHYYYIIYMYTCTYIHIHTNALYTWSIIRYAFWELHFFHRLQLWLRLSVPIVQFAHICVNILVVTRDVSFQSVTHKDLNLIQDCQNFNKEAQWHTANCNTNTRKKLLKVTNSSQFYPERTFKISTRSNSVKN